MGFELRIMLIKWRRDLAIKMGMPEVYYDEPLMDKLNLLTDMLDDTIEEITNV